MAFALGSAGLALWAVLRPGVADMTVRWPTVQSIDTLAAYVGPAAPVDEIDDYSEHLPALPRQEIPVAPEPYVAEAPQPTWRLSAILIAGDRPVAIIDDQQVRPGDRLEDGTIVEEIGPGQVILTDPYGRRYTLRIADGTGAF